MKKSIGILLAAVFIFATIFVPAQLLRNTFHSDTSASSKLTSQASSTKPSLINWQSDRPIKQALTATAGAQKINLGNLATDQANVSIPSGTFPTGTAIAVVTPDNAPPIKSTDGAPIGIPISITGGDKSGRLDQLITVTMKIDKSKLDANQQACLIWATFYDGQQWQYFRPDSVDLQAGTMTFSMAHLCLFGATKIKVDKYVEKYVHSKTAGKLVQGKVDEIVDEVAKKTIDHILYDQLGMSDKSLSSKVLGSLLKDDEYRKLYDTYDQKDVLGFCQTLNVFAGKKIAENVDKGILASALKTVSGGHGVGYVDAAAQAAGYLAEGNYKGAGEIIGGKISEEFFVVNAVTVAMEITRYGMDVWKNSEIEAAYQAYKTGDNGGCGYSSACKGDINQTMMSLRGGVERQLGMDAINHENKLRTQGGQPPLSAKEEDAIKAKVLTDLKQLFLKRTAADQQMDAEQAKLKALIDAYDASGLFDNTSWYRISGFEMEGKLDELLKLRDKILRDTAGKNLTIADIIALSKDYFTGTVIDGNNKYLADLKSKFGINLTGGIIASPSPVPSPTPSQNTSPRPSPSKVPLTGTLSGYGCQITYTISGADLYRSFDTNTPNPINGNGDLNRNFQEGYLTGNALTISGTVRAGNAKWNAYAGATVGDDSKKWWSAGNEGGSDTFNISVPIPKGSNGYGYFGVQIDCGSAHLSLSSRPQLWPAQSNPYTQPSPH